MNHQLKEALAILAHEAGKRSEDHQVVQSNGSVFWRVRRDSWCTAGKLTVQSEDLDCYRFENNIEVSFPKRIWPFRAPSLDDVGIMNVIAHKSELEQLAPLLIEIAMDASRQEYISPFFKNGIVKPWYARSIRAEEVLHYRAK